MEVLVIVVLLDNRTDGRPKRWCSSLAFVLVIVAVTDDIILDDDDGNLMATDGFEQPFLDGCCSSCRLNIRLDVFDGDDDAARLIVIDVLLTVLLLLAPLPIITKLVGSMVVDTVLCCIYCLLCDQSMSEMNEWPSLFCMVGMWDDDGGGDAKVVNQIETAAKTNKKIAKTSL